MLTITFINTVYNTIQQRSPDLAETFLRCVKDEMSKIEIKRLILRAIEPEYASVDQVEDLFKATAVSDEAFIDRLTCEFLGVLLNTNFPTESILVPLTSLTQRSGVPQYV